MSGTLELPFSGTSDKRPDVSAFQIIDSIAGIGLEGISKGSNPFPFPLIFSIGVRGISQGVPNANVPPPIPGQPPAIFQSVGVWGLSDVGTGVQGNGVTGVYGQGASVNGTGVHGDGANGVVGLSSNASGSGVFGQNNTDGGIAVQGSSSEGEGVRGVSGNPRHAGVVGISTAAGGHGVFGACDNGGTGIIASSANGIGIAAKGGRLAGRFEGDVEVTGDLRLANADCAEDFDIADVAGSEPGCVMVLDDQGTLRPSHAPYDTRVAGVISGAGTYRPGIILDHNGPSSGRLPVALLGKVYCNVDASEHPVQVGDLLTTASIPGHAMKAVDQARAFGAVIGKALRPLAKGQAQIPILIALQ